MRESSVYQAILAEGREERLTQGLSQGLSQGLAQGRTEEALRLVLRMVQRWLRSVEPDRLSRGSCRHNWRGCRCCS